MSKPRIYICLAAHEKWYGKLIRKILGCPINHAFILYEDELWGGWWATDILLRVQNIPAEKARERYSYVECYESNIDLTPGLRTLRDYVGTTYDFKGLLWGIFRLLIWKWFKIEILKPFHSLSKLVCTEGVAEVLKNSSVPSTEKWEPSNIDPYNLRLFMMGSPHMREKEYPV